MLISGNPLKREDLEPLQTQCYIATVAGTEYAVGDRVIKVHNHNSASGGLSTTNPSYFLNTTTDVQLATAPTAAELVSNFRRCDSKVDAELDEKFATDTATGEIVEVYEVTLFDDQGANLGTPYYVLANGSGGAYTPPAGVVIADSPVRVVVGNQLVSVADTVAGTLTVPAFTAGAHIQVHQGNDVKVTTGAAIPATGLTGSGNLVCQGENIILHSNIEVGTFKVIAVDGSAPAELYIEYFNTSIETGI